MKDNREDMGVAPASQSPGLRPFGVETPQASQAKPLVPDATQRDLFMQAITPPDGVWKGAKISPCGAYRYELTRAWELGKPDLPIIMLNPSTADAELDDPTIRRCIAFAKREGYGGIIVANLFAFRATSPANMRAAKDPVGPDGNAVLEWLLERSVSEGTPVLAAWGTHGLYRNRAAAVLGMATLCGARLVCLGVTAAGDPRHPLYVKGDQPFEPWPAQGGVSRMGGDAEGGSGEPKAN